MIEAAIVSGFATAVGKSNLAKTLRDGVVNFLVDKAKGITGDELTRKIESLRSDAKLNKQIQGALERAAKQWAEDSPETVTALKEDHDRVRDSAVRALSEIAERFSLVNTPDMLDKIKAALEYPGLENFSFYGSEPKKLMT